MYRIKNLEKNQKINTKTLQIRAGFTLPEVIVASVLLLIVFVPLLKALTQANLNSVIIERKTQSLAFAQSKLNQIKAKSIYNYSSNFTEKNTTLAGAYLCNVKDKKINNNLRAITVSAGYDKNANGTLGNDEIEITLQTKIAKRW